MSLLQNVFNEHQQVIALVQDSCLTDIIKVSSLMMSVLEHGGTIYWCGNGGSAADSQHLAAELVGRFKADRRPLRSIALSTDTSVLTSVANDYSFDTIFSRQVEALGRPGDLLIGISTSGNSPNVLNAFQAAKLLGLKSVGLLGNDGGGAKGLVEHAIVIPSNNTARIQEAHILIGHCFCDLIEVGLGLA
jgi:D-sedoheptulose 7-phosphate isomerase